MAHHIYYFVLIAVLALDQVCAQGGPGRRQQQGRPPQGRQNPNAHQQRQQQQRLMEQAMIRRRVDAKLWCKDEQIKKSCDPDFLTYDDVPGIDAHCFAAISREDRGDALAPCSVCDPPVSSADTVCKQCSDAVRQLILQCQEDDKNKLPDFYKGLWVLGRVCTAHALSLFLCALFVLGHGCAVCILLLRGHVHGQNVKNNCAIHMHTTKICNTNLMPAQKHKLTIAHTAISCQIVHISVKLNMHS